MLAVPKSIVLDMRYLQDPDYAERGVGRHARGLIHQAVARDEVRLIGIVDEGLPTLSPELRELLHGTAPNAYAAASALGWRPGCFVSLSPMTHDPLWTARLMANPQWLRASVVYDFIPRREPERYLPTEASRIRYATQLKWLAQSDVFAPISHSAGQDLRTLLNVRVGDMVVTGCALDPIFERTRATAQGRLARHILVVGGGDPRKDPETVVRAHARAAALQRGQGVPLVIAGSYGPVHAAAFRGLAAEAGGRPDLVEVPGHVPDAALIEMYAGAMVIVSASRDEGFSLPVVEGMAAGLPALASDIPAHRELVEDPALRFPPGDEVTLTPLLERIATDAAWRWSIQQQQDAIWPRFRAEAVGDRFWNTVLGRFHPALPSVLRGRRPRVALLSPLPPDRSGVADYTAATCAELGKLVDLHVFTPTKAPQPLQATASIRPLSALPHLVPDFDRVVSVVGNSHFHLRIFDLMLRHGSACIAHDARMLGFYRIHLGLPRTLALAGRELGRSVTESDINAWLGDESRLETLFLSEIAEAASPMIVHSLETTRLMRERHGVSAAYIPFSIYRPFSSADFTPVAREQARRRLGLAPDEVAIVTFGFVHATKAPEECIWALDVLRGWGIPASLHFVGSTEAMPDNGASLRALIDYLALTEKVTFAEGFVPEQMYKDYLIGADLGIQLRTYGHGGLSGALMDCAAAGLPTVTNASLHDAVGVPQGYTRAIPDVLSPLLLATALAELVESRPTADAAWVAERRAFWRQRGFPSYARELCRILGLEVEPASHERVSAVA